MSTTTEQYRCISCGKSFTFAKQLRMHTIRMHTGQYRTPPHTTREQQLAQKRKYNAAMRARNIAKGLTSAGKPRKKPFTGKRGNNRWPVGYVPKTKRQYYLEAREKNYSKGLNAKGQPYRNSKLSRAMRESWATRKGSRLTTKGKPAAARLSNNGLHNIRLAQQARRRREKAAKRRVFVYPPPDLPRGEEQAQPQLPQTKVFNFCPHCGEKLNQH